MLLKVKSRGQELIIEFLLKLTRDPLRSHLLYIQKTRQDLVELALQSVCKLEIILKSSKRLNCNLFGK